MAWLQLQAHGRVVRPFIGIKMLQLDAGKSEQLRQRDASFPAVRAGILVPEVSHGSPAHCAGLQPGDVIVGERFFITRPTAVFDRCMKEFCVCFQPPYRIFITRLLVQTLGVLQQTFYGRPMSCHVSSFGYQINQTQPFRVLTC